MLNSLSLSFNTDILLNKTSKSPSDKLGHMFRKLEYIRTRRGYVAAAIQTMFDKTVLEQGIIRSKTTLWRSVHD